MQFKKSFLLYQDLILQPLNQLVLNPVLIGLHLLLILPPLPLQQLLHRLRPVLLPFILDQLLQPGLHVHDAHHLH